MEVEMEVEEKRKKIKKEKEEAIRDWIVSELVEGHLYCAILVARNHSALNIVPMKYLSEFVDEVISLNKLGKSEKERIKCAYEVVGLRNFADEYPDKKNEIECIYIRVWGHKAPPWWNLIGIIRGWWTNC